MTNENISDLFKKFLATYRNNVDISANLKNDLFAAFKAGIDYGTNYWYNKHTDTMIEGVLNKSEDDIDCDVFPEIKLFPF